MVFSVLNGIPFVHLLSFKIPLRPDKYWMVLQMLNDILYCSFIFYHSIYHWDQYIYRWHSQWRWMVLNGNWMVLNGTSSVQWYTVRCLFYHSKYHWDQQIYRWCLQWYWTVLNGIERYWMVYRWPIFIRATSPLPGAVQSTWETREVLQVGPRKQAGHCVPGQIEADFHGGERRIWPPDSGCRTEALGEATLQRRAREGTIHSDLQWSAGEVTSPIWSVRLLIRIIFFSYGYGHIIHIWVI